MRTLLPSFVTALSRKNNDKQLHSPFRYSAFVSSFMPRCLSQPCYLSTSAYVLPTLSLGLSNNPRKLNEAKFIHSFPFTTMLWLGGLGKETRAVYFSSLPVAGHTLLHFPKREGDGTHRCCHSTLFAYSSLSFYS